MFNYTPVQKTDRLLGVRKIQFGYKSEINGFLVKSLSSHAISEINGFSCKITSSHAISEINGFSCKITFITCDQ